MAPGTQNRPKTLSQKAVKYTPILSGEKAIAQIREGYPVAAYESMQREMALTARAFSEITRIPERTLARRKIEGKLNADESDKLFRLAAMWQRAEEVLGSIEQARAWLKSPKKALGGKTPLEYADTDPGIRAVENLLGRIEHGVFS